MSSGPTPRRLTPLLTAAPTLLTPCCRRAAAGKVRVERPTAPCVRCVLARVVRARTSSTAYIIVASLYFVDASCLALADASPRRAGQAAGDGDEGGGGEGGDRGR